jgi:2-hydroxychromene-2-carboxylate isomerase
MAKHVDYYFFLSSPWTYLGHGRFEALVEKFELDVTYRPMDAGKVFPQSGGLPLGKRAPQRQAYRMMELNRWRDRLGIALNPEPRYFPVSTDLASRMVLSAIGMGLAPGKLIGAVLGAVWTEERDVSDEATLREIAAGLGYDGEALLAAAAQPEAEAAYEASTQEAIDRNVFGAPTWIIGDDLLWGQDRLEFVERAIAG